MAYKPISRICTLLKLAFFQVIRAGPGWLSQQGTESKPGKENGFKGTDHKSERPYFRINILKQDVTVVYFKQISECNIQPIMRVKMSRDYRTTIQTVTIVDNVSRKQPCI